VLKKRLDAIILVPIGPKREKLLDSDDKKARLSVKIAIALHTPSSYLPDAKASRGRTRFFIALRARMPTSDRLNRYSTPPLPSRPKAHLTNATTRDDNTPGKKEPQLFFPSSGSI
jgi:hypothetical protein